MWIGPLKSHSARTRYQTESSLTSRLIEVTYGTPCRLISHQKKETSGRSHISECTLMYAHPQRTNIQAKGWDVESAAHMHKCTHTHTHTGRSSSTSQGQWHTSAWIITLSHSSSRLRITSYRRPLGKVGVRLDGGGWGVTEEKTEGKGKKVKTTQTDTLLYVMLQFVFGKKRKK